MRSLTLASRPSGGIAVLHRAEPSVRFAAAFALLNLPYWLLSQWVFISRPWFNVELALPLLLATVSRPLGVATLTIEWLLDLGVSQSFTYHFSSPLEFVRSLSFLGNIQVFDFVSISNVGLIAPFALCAAGALNLLPRRPFAWRPALALAAALIFVDVANGSSMLWQRPTWVVPANPTGSPVLTLVVKAWNERNPAALRSIPSRSAVDIAALPAWAAAHRDGSILVVIVESMGWSSETPLNGWLRGRLFDAQMQARFDFSEAQVRFAGSTTSAELRELCGLFGSHRQLLTSAHVDCLPARLAGQGWKTVGLHGFSGHMFDRADWWSRLGLQSRLFAEDILGPADDRCGSAFAGACDADVIQAALREARLPRRFVYVLTLNSHLPLAASPIPDDLRDICARIKAGPDVCLLTATIGKGLAALRDGLKSSARSDLAVVVVGDHAPPLSGVRDRLMYDKSHVAAFILKSRPQ